VTDPLGGINTLWPLFGIANQMLAAIALTLCTVVLVKMKRERYAWVPLAPTVWLAVCTLTAGAEKLFHPNPAIGFLAHRIRFAAALEQGRVLAPASGLADMRTIVTNDTVDALMCALFMALVIAMLVYGVRAVLRAHANPNVSTREVGYDLSVV
jgi:carbon starvation protein